MSDNLTIDSIDKWLNFQLIQKPEQSGKTFMMIHTIIKDLTQPIEGKETINLIFCDNNLLLTKQTSTRIETDLKKYIVDDEIYIELSSHSRTNYHDYSSVFTAIVGNSIKNIICCTNSPRMNDISRLINLLNAGRNTRDKYIFKIWLDEADKFIKFIDETLRPLVNEHSNVDVKLLTATSEPLFKKYKYLNVLPIENTTSELYHGWEDNNIRIIEMECNYLDFIEHVLDVVAPTEINPGTKWFIPGLMSKKSHSSIKDICVRKGMAVMCINGDGILITMPVTMETFKYKKDEEFSNKIKDIYNERELHRFPLVITGYICIGRGITIMSNDFILDYAILSQSSNKNEASQIAGRVKGNIKGFINYKIPTVFTTDKFNEVAVEWENKSRNIAKLAFEKEQNGILPIINKTEFDTCDKDYNYICHPHLFDTFEEAKNFLSTKENEMRSRVRISKKNVIHECEGYFITSKLLRPGQKTTDLTKNDRITLEKAKHIPYSRSISSTSKGSKYLILPVYENEDSPPQDVKFQVRYINFD
jgi:hypothetical protein